ncbi:MAG: hypothetical protein MJA29_02805, partial [Candidatus Omnitrophica bacterium]|nr:hypothetical protein [Candidatus Omnitrophota bacterium]
MGNRQWVDVGGNNTTYTVDADTNRYTQWGSSNATYDYLGSMVSSGEWNYTYDKENRLTGASDNQTTASYTYDAFGRRIEKSVNGTVTKFVYSGDQIVAEYASNGTLLRKYIYGPGIDEPLAMITANNTSYYYHAAGLGSVSEVTDSNRAVVESYSYDVYGETQIKDDEGEVISESAIGNRYGFTGREYDGETGLYHYRARSYNPEVGRFM